jgi:hypothetical protein
MLSKIDVYEHLVKLKEANIFVIHFCQEVKEDNEGLESNDLNQILVNVYDTCLL